MFAQLFLFLAIFAFNFLGANAFDTSTTAPELFLEPRLAAEYKQAHKHDAASDPSLRIPFAYPLFSQCDAAWGGDLMNTKTVCQVGCLMSSTSMGLSGSGILIPSPDVATINASDPHTLNQWLRLNGGYDGSNNFIESALPPMNAARISWPPDAMHKTNDLPFATIAQYLDKGRVVIANVHDGHHFVLLTGYSTTDADTFAVNDPGYDVSTYSYSKDVVGYRIFDMVRE